MLLIMNKLKYLHRLVKIKKRLIFDDSIKINDDFSNIGRQFET